MNQIKEKLLSQKHTGFEDLSTFFNISSLPSSADFFFINIHLTPVAETNELSSLTYFLIQGRFITDLFYAIIPT